MIEFKNVTKSYSVGNTALNGVSMKIEDGEFVFLVGPSGSGKSTIIRLITGELKPSSGHVHVLRSLDVATAIPSSLPVP